MSGIRNHGIFTIRVEYDHQERIEDEYGELRGYSEVARIKRVIAPSEAVARAWVMNALEPYNPEITSVTCDKIDVCLLESIW